MQIRYLFLLSCISYSKHIGLTVFGTGILLTASKKLQDNTEVVVFEQRYLSKPRCQKNGMTFCEFQRTSKSYLHLLLIKYRLLKYLRERAYMLHQVKDYYRL